MKILCSISTKNRYDTYLPLAIMSMINQTRKPDHLTIYDDNDSPKDLREVPVYQHLFQMLNIKGIGWNVQFGAKKGQSHNHQKANKSGFDWVFRLDDDCIAEPDVLEKLSAQIKNDVGGVGCSIITPPLIDSDNRSSSIDNLYAQNKQWFMLNKTEEVDHLHCSFLYRAGVVDYDLRLSKKCHREETMFSYGMKLKGYKNIITPAIIWHLKASGGIRSDNNKADYDHDERIFNDWLNNTNNRDQYLVVLDCGLGDHLVFKKDILPKLKEKHENIVLSVCHPYLFPDEKTISIADAQRITDIDKYNIYKLGVDINWQGSLKSLFEKMYLSEDHAE